jgi:N-acetylmuramoyl-L-alanine amidase
MTIGRRAAAVTGALFTVLSIPLLASAAWGQSAPPAKRASASTVPAPSCNRAQFRVLVDVGHTAEAPGAASARGVMEYDFNRSLAKTIERKLVEMGFGRTIMLVTEGSTRKGLVTRVAHANASKADLFLSIHHDSVPDRLMQKWEFEGKKHAYNDQYPGHSIFVSVDNPHYQESLLFAAMIGKEMKARGLRYTPHYTDAIMGSRRRVLVDADAGVYRYDQLIVLRNTEMPAVLLEAGSIVNRKDELALSGHERQSVVASAVGAAVDRYCSMRQAPEEQLQAQQRSAPAPTRAARTVAAPDAAKAGSKPQRVSHTAEDAR